MTKNVSLKDLLPFIKNYLPKLITVGFIVVVLSFLISWISLMLADFLPSKADSSTLADLSVNSILVSVTIIYVLATLGILTKTEESIKQNEKNIELALNTQERIQIQQQLEQFYCPLSDFLKSTVHISEGKTKDGSSLPSINLSIQIRNEEYKENTQCNKIISHSYLARRNTKFWFSQFLTFLYENRSSTDTELISVFENLVISINSDIDELNEKLEGLMNLE